MRILHIIGTLDPRAGGPTEAVRILIQHSPPEVIHEAVTLDDPAAPFLRDLAFPIHALGPQRSTYGYTPKFLPWLRANRSRFDGVLVHGLWQFTSLAARLTLPGHVPYMVFPHGMLDPYFRRAFPTKHLKKWLYWLPAEYWVLRGARHALFTCQAEADLARQSFWLHRWDPVVVPFGTVPPPGDPIAQREAFLTLHPALRNRRFLLFLGRIHPKKAPDLLVDAFLKLAPSHPDIDLVMAGPDPDNLRPTLEHAALASGVASRIHWTGMLSGDPKWGAFYAAEAFVLPSHQENFGIAVAEALACGLPVLLSDKVNIASEIQDDRAGLMEPDTPTGTERLLTRWFVLTPAEREAYSARALACFQSRYDMSRNTRTILHLFTAARPATK